MPKLTHPEFATYRDSPEGMSMARELAEARGGVSIAALLRMLVREEAKRLARRASLTATAAGREAETEGDCDR